MSNYICAIDLGSSKIAGTVARIKRGRISGIFFDAVPAKGIKRGIIIDSINLVDCLSRLLKDLRAKSGINIKYVSASISGQDITTKHSHAVIPLAERGNKVITLSDMRKVAEQARILGCSLEEEIIQRIPFAYAIDSRSNIPNPLGLYSHKLEIDLYLICARLSSLQSLTRAINQAGYEVRNVLFSGLATSKIVFNKEFKEGTNIFCDIGSDITELLIFREGILRDIDVLVLGGDELTTELSGNLKISFDLAEDTKRSYGMVADNYQISEDQEILVKKSDIYKPIKQKLVCSILASKAKSICQKIKETVDNKVEPHQINNFIVVGRTILLEGFLEMLENTLGIPVKVGRITEPRMSSLVSVENNLSGQKYLNYLTCLGIICEVLKGSELQAPPLSQPAANPLLKLIHRFKEVYQEYF